MKIKYLVALILILSFSVLFSSSKEDRLVDEDENIELTGIVKVKGNMPHSFIVLEIENGHEYILTGPKTEEIRRSFQLRKLLVTGELIKPSFEKKLAEVYVLKFELLEK